MTQSVKKPLLGTDDINQVCFVVKDIDIGPIAARAGGKDCAGVWGRHVTGGRQERDGGDNN